MIYTLTVLIIIYLIIDNPLLELKKSINKIIIKSFKILITAIIFLYIYVLLNNKTGISNQLISGTLLSGLVLIYIISGEHSGIEDKMARKTFKTISWLFLWIILFLHLFYV